MTEEQQQVPENRQEVLTLSEVVLQVPDWAGMQAISAQAMALGKQFKAIDFAALIGPQSIVNIELIKSQLIADWAAEIEQPLRSAAMRFNPNLITDWAARIEPRRSAPAHLPAMPAPEPTVQAVHSGDAELLHLVGQSLKAGRLSHNDLLALILDSTESKPGQQEAPLDIKLKLNDRYESLKAKYGREFTQEIFVTFHAAEIWACSLATFERYRRQIKAFKQSGIL